MIVRDELCLEKIVAAAEDTMTYVINKHNQGHQVGTLPFLLFYMQLLERARVRMPFST